MSFSFDGILCDEMGMIVERYPARQFPERKQTIYQIPGKSGALIVDEDAFENVRQEYEVYVRGKTGITMQRRLTKIANWLLSNPGYRKLTDTYDPEVYRLARFVGGMEFVNSLNKYGKGTLVFDCMPQRYPIEDEKFDFVIGQAVTIPELSDMQPGLPLLEIKNVAANCSFRISEVVDGTEVLTITIPGRGQAISRIFVDWETQSVYNAYNGSVPSHTTVYGRFEPVRDGTVISTILETGDDTNATLYTRRFWL